MVVAEIYISQGIDDHRFIIDGETVSENSPMTGFRHKPFESWKELLIEELVEECNRDYFTLKISASISQFEYIYEQAQACNLCKECIQINACKIDNPSPVSNEVIDDSESAWSRMDRLFQQYGNALAQTKKLNFGLTIPGQFIDDYVQIMESLVRNGFTKASLILRKGYFNISLEEIDEDDQVELVDGEGDQHGPDGAGEVQIGYEQIVGDQTAGEEHGEDHHLHNHLLTSQEALGQGIGEQNRHKQGDGRARHGVEDGVSIGMEELGVGENLLVGGQIEAHREEGHLVVHDGVGIGQGHRQHVDKGHQADQQREDHHNIDNGIKYKVAKGFLCSHGAPLSKFLRRWSFC